MDAATALKAVFSLGLCLVLGMTWQRAFFFPHDEASRLTLARWIRWGLGILFAVQLARLADRFWVWTALSDNDPTFGILWQTHNGKLLTMQTAGVCLSFMLCVWRRPVPLAHLAILGGLGWALVCSAFAGHAAAATETMVQTTSGVLHGLLAHIWLSGVMGLVATAGFGHGHHAQWRVSLARFSRVALPGMLLVLLSGLSIATWSVGSWPALLVTPYGVWLMLKLCAVGGALWCAWQLRRWLTPPENAHRLAQVWVRREAGFAALVLSLATLLAATVPAAHETLNWPFPFRWAPVLSWRQNMWTTLLGLSAGVALGLSGVVWWRWSRNHGRRVTRVAGVCMAMGGIGLGLWAIGIEAYPTTYAHSPLRLDVGSVQTGQRLYDVHCAGCHGLHGHGDGPLAKAHDLQPANLTEPHVSWHTHGDMYWWLSRGKGQMPGFENILTEEDRWHLINWLIVLSMGHEARSIATAPAPFNPWLPAIDFRFPMDKDRYFSLSEWRGVHPVHLVVINQPQEMPRVKDLLADMKGFPAQLVIVAKPEWLNDVVKGPCEAILVGDPDGEIANAWAMYRRSFASPDFNNEAPKVARTEFLIDRYGFVRARWRSDETPPSPSVSELKTLYDNLNGEGEIRSAAIHQHD